MRLPRVRFTVRRMMVAVVAVGLLFGLAANLGPVVWLGAGLAAGACATSGLAAVALRYGRWTKVLPGGRAQIAIPVIAAIILGWGVMVLFAVLFVGRVRLATVLPSARVLRDHAVMAAQRGRTAEAEALFRSALNHQEKQMVAGDPGLVDLLDSYEAFLRRAGRVKHADEVGVRIKAIVAHYGR